MEDITGVLLFSILATGDPPHMEMTNTSRNEVCGAAMITGASCLDTGVPLIVTRKPSMKYITVEVRVYIVSLHIPRHPSCGRVFHSMVSLATKPSTDTAR